MLDGLRNGVRLNLATKSPDLVPWKVKNSVDGFKTASREFRDECPVRCQQSHASQERKMNLPHPNQSNKGHCYEEEHGTVSREIEEHTWNCFRVSVLVGEMYCHSDTTADRA